MTQNQSIPINTSSPTLSSKQPAGPGNGHPALCSDGVSDGGIWKSWASGRNGGGAGPRDSFTENKPAWGGKRLRGRRRKKKQRKSAGGNTRESKKRERGECLRLQRIKNCAISKRASPAQIKLVSGHEGLAPWHHILAWPNPHHHISRPQRSREMPACIFGGKTLEQFLRADVCHIISFYSGFITQLRRHFTMCDSNVLMYDMMKVLADRALRRSFTARGEGNYAVAYLAWGHTRRRSHLPVWPSVD